MLKGGRIHFPKFVTKQSIHEKMERHHKPPGYWDNDENILLYLNELKKKYNLKNFDDWNSLTRNQIQLHGGATLLKKYSLHELKCKGFPGGKFYPLHKIPGYWNKEENVIQFLNNLKEKLHLKTPEEWNSLNQKIIQSNGGSSLLQKYSLFELKCMGFPEDKSKFTFEKKPSGYWDDEKNIIKYLNDLKFKYNFQTPQDWNSLNQKIIQINGGSSLLQKYSLYQLKCLGCPEGKLFFEPPNQQKPLKYWSNIQNVSSFVQSLKEKYNFKSPEDWNSLTINQIISNGGATVLKNFSLYDIKCIGCPEGKSSFFTSRKSPGYWENEQNIYQFLISLKQKYNFNTPEDWNSLSWAMIQENGGFTLREKYSLFDLKCIGCPEGKSRFSPAKKPPGFWDNTENITEFMEHLKDKMNLKTKEDWERLSHNQIKYHGGTGLAMKYSVPELIKMQTQTTDVNIKNPTSKRSSQRWLFLQVQKLFPGEEIVEDYFHSEISRESGFAVQFDVYVVKRKIAIEYHGQQHFQDIPSHFTFIENYNQRDKEKEKLCIKYGINLIAIPYWWDNNLESLKETLNTKLDKANVI